MTNKPCITCGTQTTNPKFCSRNCAARHNNKVPKRKLTRKCNYCNSIVRNYKSRLCEYHFQASRGEALRNRTLQYYTERESIKTQGPSSKFAHIRNFCRFDHKDKTKLPCAVCGYDKHVELCHIKPISSFPLTATVSEINDSNNVIQLCPNCHWEFDNGLLILAFPDQP